MIINISPPFWWTWWAILFYLTILVFIVYFIIRYYRIKHDLDYQVVLKEKQEELHQAKLNLFTYFSHELRTPLSLILGPLEDILDKSTTPSFLNKPLQLMYQNAKRLLLLVNELMDFRKQETGQFTLKAAAGNFEKFTEEIMLAFSELTLRKEIQLNLTFNTESQPLWYDRSLFEKILLNLLSNAFKYTPDKGKIELNLTSTNLNENLKQNVLKHNSNAYISADRYLLITLSDTGDGIPEKEIENVFNPFYQIYNQHEDTESSSGIGLSLTKGLVELHHGSIWAEFNNATGATFKILLPYGNDHLNPNEIIENYQDSENIDLYLEDIPKEQANSTAPKSKKHTILIVEDNKELRTYIKSCLGNFYKVLEAGNGKEGIEIAINQMPDMIISDIMMPVMDGLQLCKKLKEDINTSHIPIILLTARVTMLQMKEGLELGADDYITKPFSSNILMLKIKNIILSRENLKNLYGKQFSLESMGVEVISADDKFMQKLYKVVEKHIDNPDLNIEKFCDEINMSSANLYRKIKAVTNLSPLEYVKSVRMQLAAKMLMETDLSITEVSEKVGFNSLIHFSSTFRKHFGFSPTKYVNNEKKHLSDNSD